MHSISDMIYLHIICYIIIYVADNKSYYVGLFIYKGRGILTLSELLVKLGIHVSIVHYVLRIYILHLRDESLHMLNTSYLGCFLTRFDFCMLPPLVLCSMSQSL